MSKGSLGGACQAAALLCVLLQQFPRLFHRAECLSLFGRSANQLFQLQAVEFFKFHNLAHDDAGEYVAMLQISYDGIAPLKTQFSLRTLIERAKCRIVPGNTGGFGAVLPVAKVFARNEIEPLQMRFKEINEWLGEEVVTFRPYVIDGLEA